jgi:hypothetical protein
MLQEWNKNVSREIKMEDCSYIGTLLLAVDEIIIHKNLNMYTPYVLQQWKSSVIPGIKLEDYGCINILFFFSNTRD